MEAVVACRSKTYQASRNVWSDGSTTAIYHSMLRFSRAEWARARISLIGEGGSGNITVSSAVAYGDDESDFDNPSSSDFPTTPTSITTTGSQWGAAYSTFDVTKQLVDVGVKVRNTSSGGKMEHMRITVVVDVAEEA
jgi:hypothetical protein